MKIVLAGDGSDRPRLARVSRGLNLENVEFYGVQPPGEYEAMLRSADVLLVNQRSAVADMSMASKLTSYFAADKPVLAAVGVTSETAREVRASGGGRRRRRTAGTPCLRDPFATGRPRIRAQAWRARMSICPGAPFGRDGPRKVRAIRRDAPSRRIGHAVRAKAAASLRGPRQLRSWIRAGRPVAGSIAAGVYSQAALVVTGVIVARALGPVDRGHLAFLLLLPSVLRQVGTLGLPSATTFFIARSNTLQAEIVRAIRTPVILQIVLLTIFQGVLLWALVGDEPSRVWRAGLLTLGTPRRRRFARLRPRDRPRPGTISLFQHSSSSTGDDLCCGHRLALVVE